MSSGAGSITDYGYLGKGPWRTDKWWVSNLNYEPSVVKSLKFPGEVLFHDVTLRDGEQTPGVVLRKDEKIEISRALDELGVQRIEAGMPVVSEDDFQAVREVARLGLRSKIFAFSRVRRDDIDVVLKTDVDGVIVEGPVGYPKLVYQFKWDLDRVLSMAREAIDYAKAHGLYTVFFGVDATRTDLGLLTNLFKTLEEETRVDGFVVADTYGSLTPEAAKLLFNNLKRVLRKPLEFHGHNDFGLATSTSIAALSAGAEVVHVSVNGIGERAGNASLEEVALTLKLLYGANVSLRLEKLQEVSRLVERLTGFKVAPNKPVVGERVFTRESGIGVAGWLKYKLGSEAYLPELVGNKHGVLIGKKSGRHAIEWKLDQLGLRVGEEDVPRILAMVKKRSEELKRALSDSEFIEIVREVVG